MSAENEFYESKRMTLSDLEQKLAEHYKTIKELFESAFSLIDFARNEGNVFVVFIARRCFILAYIFLRALIPTIGVERYVYRLSRVFSDGGLRILSKKLAREFFRNDRYICRIFLIDDILIHGRAVGGLLSAAEDIFAQEYLSLRDINPGKGKNYTEAQLHDKFLSFISIKNGYISTQPNLLRERYKRRIDTENIRYTEPSVWRCASNRIANIIFNSEIPNAAFIPGILFNDNIGLSRQMIRESFDDIKMTDSFLRGWVGIRSEYKGRTMDSYMITIPSYNNLNSVFTIRCTEDYVMPFIFLPMLDEVRIRRLEKNIIFRLEDREYKDTLNLLRFFSELRRIGKLSNMYAELITLVYSVSLLRAFLDELRFESCFDKNNFSVNDYLIRNTTVPIISGNFAHDPTIEGFLAFLFDPFEKPLFSMEEICCFISGQLKKDSPVLDNVYYSAGKDLSDADRDRLVNNLERVIFRYGMDSEIEAYRLSTGMFAPSYDSVEYFYFPKNNNLEKVLQSIYGEDHEWMKSNVSIYDTFSYILQMMDHGNLALITGVNDNNLYMQCLKAGEQSLNDEASKFALALPLMNEIEQRCQRKGRPTYRAFIEELYYFNTLVRIYLDKDDSKQLKDACDLLQDSGTMSEIKEFEMGLYEADHRSRDYFFTLKDALSAIYHCGFESFIEDCRDFYYRVIYG